ncbi:folate-binding protein [Nakamurella silvestris]|nr:folate-binding protein [Nakamurella silvestris]
MTASPLLHLPGAVAASGIDEGIAWHYGDPIGEQRKADSAAAFIDRSNRGLITVSGPDRHDWLNKITSQLLDPFAEGDAVQALVLSAQGHVEHHFGVTEVNEVMYLDTEPGTRDSLLKYLEMMKFWAAVTIEVVPDWGQVSVVGPKALTVLEGLGITDRVRAQVFGNGLVRPTARGFDVLLPLADLPALAGTLVTVGVAPAGTWADDALRIIRREPRLGVDTDEKTIPNEVNLLGSAVHLNKGCYRGQETVARVNNLGRPPRRLALLNLDGTQDVLPNPGDPVLTAEGRTVGRVGTVAQHHEDGPIALALIKRTIQPGMPLLAGGVDAQVDPADAVLDSGPASAGLDRAGFAAVRRDRTGPH